MPISKTLDQIKHWDSEFARKFPARIRRVQKLKFIGHLRKELNQRDFFTEDFRFKVALNNDVLTTKCPNPRIIFLAHYDTPTIIPFWMAWIFQLFGHTRQISAMVFMIVLLFGGYFISLLLTGLSSSLDLAIDIVNAVILISLFSMAIPNPRNREDNTSGVIGLLALADWMKDKPEIKQHVQFAFLDNEEWGLLGSKGLKEIWDKHNHPYSEACIINLDCISRGRKPLIVHHRNATQAQKITPFLKKYLPGSEIMDMNIIPLSDNFTFKEEGAVDISFAEPTILPGGYYIPKIHAPADNDFDADNLFKLIQGLMDFTEAECSP